MRMTLGQQISRLKHLNNSTLNLASNRVIGRGIIKLIQVQPFYGILMAKLDRNSNLRLKAPLGLGWLNRQICLEYNVHEMVRRITTATELLFWLEHEALHLVYLHPARYPRSTFITQVATDVTVNQDVTRQISHELTLEKVNRQWNLDLPAGLNSAFYLRQLRSFFMKLQHDQSKNKVLTNQKLKRILQRSDDHHFWGSEPQLGQSEKLTQLKQLVKRSYQSAGAKARGTLPGRVHEQLQRLTVPNTINWRSYIKIGLGNVPFGRKVSRARFNRRQAYRMDLMGTVSNYVQSARIFVDNSGSMSNSEISYLLAQLSNFLKQFPINVDVYSFDTQIHVAKRYRANNYHQLKFTRVGGGGTRFQSIFDYCHHHLQGRQSQLIIILTDGYGEPRLNYYGFYNLLWILTSPTDQFSVKDPRGHIVSLVNDPSFQYYRFK